MASVYALSDNIFLRMTTPVRQNLTAVSRDDARATLEMENIQTDSETVTAIAPENPQFSVFGAARVNTPARQILADDQNLAYSIGVSDLSVIPVYPTGNRGVVTSEDGTPKLRPGGFVTINGLRLANAATATSIPAPIVLGPAVVQVRSILRLEQSDPVVVTIRR